MTARTQLIGLLDAVGFDDADASAFVARLSEAQVNDDLRWHDQERRWLSEGDPATWPAERKNLVTAHYLNGHGVSPFWVMNVYPGARLPAAQTAPAGNGKLIAGVAFVALVGLAAWVAGSK